MLDEIFELFDRKKSHKGHKPSGLRARIGRAIAGDDRHHDGGSIDPRYAPVEHRYRRGDDDDESRYRRDDDHRRYDDDDDDRRHSKRRRERDAFDFDFD